MIKIDKIKQFQYELLLWYDSNARLLPWRDDPSPYRVWISEIMLQQTRVETVKPYFEKFILEVPTIEDLANITEDKLLKLWEGLGYYSRARNLKKAAKIIVEEMNGVLPSNLEELLSLPGIGPYTSGAITSIAFGLKATAVDGNVLRVIARVTANTRDIKNKIIKKEIESVVKQLLPEKRIGDFNQGLMEIGATVCIPNGMPKCKVCPLQFICEGNLQGIASFIPKKAQTKARKVEYKTIFLFNYRGTIALRQRSSKGLLSNLWEFPNVNGQLSIEECKLEIEKWNLTSYKIISIDQSKHIFTHLEWHMCGYYIMIENIPQNSEFTWSTLHEIKEQYSIPSAFKEYQKYIFDHM